MDPEEIVVSIPHAGTEIPKEIHCLIPHDEHTLRNEVDLYTDRIFSVEGIRTVAAQYSRIIGDPNRAPDEIYTEGILRAMGVVMLSLPEGYDLFEEDPSLETMQEWVERFHVPFHQELTLALCNARFLIDVHSMWSSAAAGHYGGERGSRADVTLGNQYFCSCSAETTHFFQAFFEEKGYSTAINEPYPGRYILGTYCSRLALPGIQIEINRKLYMDEETLDPRDADMRKFNEEFSDLLQRFCLWHKKSAPSGEKPMTDLSEL